MCEAIPWSDVVVYLGLFALIGFGFWAMTKWTK